MRLIRRGNIQISRIFDIGTVLYANEKIPLDIAENYTQCSLYNLNNVAANFSIKMSIKNTNNGYQINRTNWKQDMHSL
jgi:hypothetical protein